MTPRPSDTTLLILGPIAAAKGTHSAAAQQLRAAGYTTVIDPTAEPGIGWQNWFTYAATAILERADGVALLPGLTQSSGAKLLLALAHHMGRPVHPPTKWVERAAARKKVPW